MTQGKEEEEGERRERDTEKRRGRQRRGGGRDEGGTEKREGEFGGGKGGDRRGRQEREKTKKRKRRGRESKNIWHVYNYSLMSYHSYKIDTATDLPNRNHSLTLKWSLVILMAYF